MQENTEIFLKDGERPSVKSMFQAIPVGGILRVYDLTLRRAIAQECFRQNEIARAIGGELNLFFRTKKKNDHIIIYRLK